VDENAKLSVAVLKKSAVGFTDYHMNIKRKNKTYLDFL
jgi:hypothetical protein